MKKDSSFSENKLKVSQGDTYSLDLYSERQKVVEGIVILIGYINLKV